MGGNSGGGDYAPKPGGGGSVRPRPGRGGDGGSSGDKCDIEIEVELERVQIAVLEGVSIGERLKVALRAPEGRSAIVCEDSDQALVGSVGAVEGLSNLISCIQQGVAYQARVTEKGTGRCRVRISRVS